MLFAPSFFAIAMAKADDNFTRRVAKHVNYPKLDDVEAIVSASYYSVPFGTNLLGLFDFLG